MTTNTPDTPPVAIINIDLSPIPLISLQDGTIVYFEADPSSGPEWVEIMGLQTRLNGIDPENGEQVEALTTDLKRMLGAFVTKEKDAWDEARLGFVTLSKILYAYVSKVNEGIPTKP